MKLLPSKKLQLEIGSKIDLFDLSFTSDPFKGITLEEVKEDPTGEYGLEGDTLVLAKFEDLHTDETLERYVYYDFETNTWNLLDGWHLD